MELGGITFCRLVALALDGQGVYQHRPPKVLGIGESFDETVQPMSLDGANVLEFQGLKQHAGGKETLE